MPAIPLDSISRREDRTLGSLAGHSPTFNRYSPILPGNVKRNSTPLLSSSIRATSSPRFIHGNSPLLQSWDVSSSSQELSPREVSASTVRSDDGLIDEDAPSPSSVDLGERLRSALEAVEELQDAVRRQRRKRQLTKHGSGSRRNLDFTGAATKSHGGLAATVKGTKADVSCLRSGDSDVVICPSQNAAIGLGLHLPQGAMLSTSWNGSESELAGPFSQSTDAPLAQMKRRSWSHGEIVACTSSQTKALSSPSQTLARMRTNFPTVVASKLASTVTPSFTTAPSTPVVDASTGTLASYTTPTIPYTSILTTVQSSAPVQSSTSDQSQTYSNAGQSQTASHAPANSLVVVACVSAAGSILLLAAVLLVLLKQRRKNNEHRQKMDAILDKVAVHTSTSDDDDDTKANVKLDQKGEENKESSNNTAANPMILPLIPASPPNELRMVTPWLSHDMPSHPFATAAVRSERFSPDLAYSGVIGQEVSKDQSFHWDFPKLSVPPAAARALASGHYIKKRSTVFRKSIPSPRLSEGARLTARFSSYCSDVTDRLSTSDDLSARNLSAAASSEMVDPLLDWQRKSFYAAVDGNASSTSKSWIKNTLRHLVQPQQSADGVSTNTEQAGTSLTNCASLAPSPGSKSRVVATEVAGDLACSNDPAQYGMPSLSIANSSIVDANTQRIMSGQQSSSDDIRRRSLRSSRPSGGFSSASEEQHQPKAESYDHACRRASGPASLGEKGTQQSFHSPVQMEGIQSATESYQIRRSKEYTSHSGWMPDTTDTEDESREGYDAEQENETEVELEMDISYHAPMLSRQDCGDDTTTTNASVPSSTFSTPVITLTCSEEEGRFERRISLTSSSRHACSVLQDHEMAAIEERIEVVNVEPSEDGNLTVVVHSLDGSDFASSSSGSDDDDDGLDLDRPDVFDCLLSDDFPTIPAWTPIQSS